MSKAIPNKKGRSNFSLDTRTQLAKRAGYYCCYPGCGKMTIGPSAECAHSTSITGMACHIVAATNGKSARRVNLNMNEDEISNISNGIWMCYSHGKLIDTDETTYSVETLKYWKKAGESAVKVMNETGCTYNEAYVKVMNKIKFRDDIRIISSNNLESIGIMLSESNFNFLFTKSEMACVRDFLMEYALNAFTHGMATYVDLVINGLSIIIKDDGNKFDINNLINTTYGRGGKKSINNLISTLYERMIIDYVYRGSNELKIFFPNDYADISKMTNCYLNIGISDIMSNTFKYSIDEECNDIFVCINGFMMISQAMNITYVIPELVKETRNLHFIVDCKCISDGVIEEIKEQFPDARIMLLNNNLD